MRYERKNKQKKRRQRRAAMEHERHDGTVDDLVFRLIQKKGYVHSNQPYYVDGVLRGEYDVHKMTRNSSGKVFHTYYEVKGRDSSKMRQKANTQFQRHYDLHPEEHWRYVYVSPEQVKRVRF